MIGEPRVAVRTHAAPRIGWGEAAALCVLLAATAARATPDKPSSDTAVSVAEVGPGVCFTAPELLAELRRRLPDLAAHAAPRAGVTVTVTVEPGAIEVGIAGRIGGTLAVIERRAVPRSTRCATELMAVAAIVARAVAPLDWKPTVEAPRVVMEEPPVAARPLPEARPRRDLHLRLALGAAWAFAPGGDASAPAGRLDVGLRYRRWVVSVGGGVQGATARADEGAGLSIAIRRFPCVVLVAWEPPVGGGALHLAAGLALDVNIARADSRAGYDEALALRPGVHAEAAYHLALGRGLALFAALDVDYLPVRDTFTAPATTFARTTPALWVGPRAGLAIDLF